MPATILVVDDSRTIRQTLALWLRTEGFVVLEAEDGQEGLGVVKARPPDLIIVDLNMPRLDGFGMISAMRADPEITATRVIILTTETSMERVTRARAMGVLGWLVKPVEREHLVAAVKKIVAVPLPSVPRG